MNPTRENLRDPSRPGRLPKPGPVLFIPVNPVLYAALRAIYAGGPRIKWSTDIYGRPYYDYLARDGHITLSYELPVSGYLPWHKPDKDLTEFQRHFLGPRWGFIYSGRLRSSLLNLSVETADVLLILLGRIAQLADPRYDIASIRLEEIAEERGVRLRHGSTRDLHQDLREEVLKLAGFRLSMVWRDYKKKRDLYFGREYPDRLLDIVDIEYQRNKNAITAFRFRCGQALAHFLDPNGLRWIGHYSKALLNLSPYHEAFTKKLGTYWTFIGITAGKKGMLPQAAPRTILDFCGEDVKARNPGQTVDAFIKAHERLQEIGLLDKIPELEPQARSKGYFKNWINMPLTVQLSKQLWKTADRKATKNRPAIGKREGKLQLLSCPDLPGTTSELQNHPGFVRSFRHKYGLNQAELARALRITRQTLSKYERGIHYIPDDKAEEILKIWKTKRKSM